MCVYYDFYGNFGLLLIELFTAFPSLPHHPHLIGMHVSCYGKSQQPVPSWLESVPSEPTPFGGIRAFTFFGHFSGDRRPSLHSRMTCRCRAETFERPNERTKERRNVSHKSLGGEWAYTRRSWAIANFEGKFVFASFASLVADPLSFFTFNTASVTCGQSYKASMIVIYDSRVVLDLKIPHITTLES